MYRFDLVFSYWIFLWFVLYYYKIVRFSPKLALIIGLVENIGLLFYMLLYKPIIFVVIFILINFFIKFMPLYYLKDENINYYEDFTRLLFVFIIYLLWVFINKKFSIDFYNNTPGTNILYDFYKKIKIDFF